MDRDASLDIYAPHYIGKDRDRYPEMVCRIACSGISGCARKRIRKGQKPKLISRH